MLAAFSIAGSAAFFSVTGLASTFHGTYWSVITMGGSLEFGKLVATSYLYKFWNKTHFILKTLILTLILTLMLITSVGIFGYLSASYQSDSIPLKQLEQKIKLLDAEKLRLIDRKQQIDNQIASLPSNYSKSRLTLMKGFEAEQASVTSKISKLETEEIELKTNVIQTESHIGPIIYIAKMLGLDPDFATKYLIYLIIFVFDPMAVALTLAVNIALRDRKNDKDNQPIILDNPPINVQEEIVYSPLHPFEDPVESLPPIHEEPIIENTPDIKLELVPVEEQHNNEVIFEDFVQLKDSNNRGTHITKLPSNNSKNKFAQFNQLLNNIKIDNQLIKDIPMTNIDENIQLENVIDIINDNQQKVMFKQRTLETLLHDYHQYKNRIERGERLTMDENNDYLSIRTSLQKHGFNVYI